jgi:hypothetical protein
LAHGETAARPAVLRSESFKHYIDSFNADDQELYSGYITNGAAWEFLKERIPLFECPDEDVQATYYFRWWTYRKHIKRTPESFIITEFLPDVPWAGKDGSISCAAGHHFYEGRWLADAKYLDDYALFWFRKGGEPRRYSFWAADAVWAHFLVHKNTNLLATLLPDLERNYEDWERDHRDTNGLFWQLADRDGMEFSIGGDGCRPTINSYMYGDAMAIANMARLLGQDEFYHRYRDKAVRLKELVQQQLWNGKAEFFETRARESGRLAGVRELAGYTPWYFNLPDADKSVAWKQLLDHDGFSAPFGLTTAEQRNPQFALSYEGHECQWNGPSWPFATSVTLTAMANLLDNYRQKQVTKQDYFSLLKTYAQSQRIQLEDGRKAPWIDEDLDPRTGVWLARALLKRRGSEILERGKDYNHSTYCDLIITGLVGIRPAADHLLVVNPLAPSSWDYFCLDQVRYHDHWLTILWDKTGQRYHRGKGLRVLVDGTEKGSRDSLSRMSVAF